MMLSEERQAIKVRHVSRVADLKAMVAIAQSVCRVSNCRDNLEAAWPFLDTGQGQHQPRLLATQTPPSAWPTGRWVFTLFCEEPPKSEDSRAGSSSKPAYRADLQRELCKNRSFHPDSPTRPSP
jgi:hypothetical protein